MVQLHFDRNAVTCKVVYYGPGLSGKTTNLEIIHNKAPADSRGEMVSIATRGDRTLYFDYLPLDLGKVQGMDTTFQLYTVPGQIYYNNTRKLVLQGVDGVVFVADSSPNKLQENKESLANLQENLQTIGLSITDIPVVLQYNKRDLPDAMPIAELDAQLNTRRWPTFEAVAKDGQGVFVTLKEIGRLVVEGINTQQQSPRRRTGNAVPQQITKKSTASQYSPLPKTVTPSASANVPAHDPAKTAPMPQPRKPKSTYLDANAPTQPIYVDPASKAAKQEPAQAPTQLARKSNGSGNGSSSRRQAVAAKKTQVHSDGNHATRPMPTLPERNEDVNPRQRHLQKAKPPSLSQRRSRNVKELSNLGHTDPHIRRYRDEDDPQPKSGAPFFRFLVGLFLALIIALVITFILVIFVPAVNQVIVPLLPEGLQDVLLHEHSDAAAPNDQPSGPTAPAVDSDTPAPQAEPPSSPAGEE
ncbi:MAG: hypothetical protein EA401_01545 [Planctomycetota bacterium]|nr:MAG: hypothetical protein EA401_01545 [Planctomycetota bacterium]